MAADDARIISNLQVFFLHHVIQRCGKTQTVNNLIPALLTPKISRTVPDFGPRYTMTGIRSLQRLGRRIQSRLDENLESHPPPLHPQRESRLRPAVLSRLRVCGGCGAGQT